MTPTLNVALLASFPLYVVGAHVREREEERLLGLRCGPAWDAHVAEVGRLLPRLTASSAGS